MTSSNGIPYSQALPTVAPHGSTGPQLGLVLGKGKRGLTRVQRGQRDKTNAAKCRATLTQPCWQQLPLENELCRVLARWTGPWQHRMAGAPQNGFECFLVALSPRFYARRSHAAHLRGRKPSQTFDTSARRVALRSCRDSNMPSSNITRKSQLTHKLGLKDSPDGLMAHQVLTQLWLKKPVPKWVALVSKTCVTPAVYF